MRAVLVLLLAPLAHEAPGSSGIVPHGATASGVMVASAAAETPPDFRLKVDSAVPARYYLSGPDGKLHAPDGAITYSRRAEQHFVMPAGFEIRLRAGTYTLRAERGPEYRPFQLTLEARPGAEKRIRIDVPRWINLNRLGWYSADLHNHRSVEQMPLLLLAEDLNLSPTITDWIWEGRHQSRPPDTNEAIRIVDATHVYSVLDKEIERLRQGPGSIDVLGLRSPLPFDGDWIYPSNEVFAREAHARGAWVDAEKILWRDFAALAALGLVDFAGIVYNHFNPHVVEWKDENTIASGMIPKHLPEYNTPAGMPLWAMDVYYRFLNCGFRLPVSAGSASGVKAAPLGYNRVYVKLPGEFSYDNWFRALKAGSSFATNGPMLFFRVDDAGPGGVIRLSKARHLRIRASVQSLHSLDRLEIVHKGKVIRTVTGASDLQIDFAFNATETGWIAARAFDKFDQTARFAHTSPVYIDRPGDRGIARDDARFFIDWIDREIAFYRELSGFREPAHRAAILDFFTRARAVYSALLH